MCLPEAFCIGAAVIDLQIPESGIEHLNTRQRTGTSPVDYWISLKIRQAKRLLREDRWNVTQIAGILGYSSIHHFTRMFKRSTGMSPSAYKSSVAG